MAPVRFGLLLAVLAFVAASSSAQTGIETGSEDAETPQNDPGTGGTGGGGGGGGGGGSSSGGPAFQPWNVPPAEEEPFGDDEYDGPGNYRKKSETGQGQNINNQGDNTQMFQNREQIPFFFVAGYNNDELKRMEGVEIHSLAGTEVMVNTCVNTVLGEKYPVCKFTMAFNGTAWFKARDEAGNTSIWKQTVVVHIPRDHKNGALGKLLRRRAHKDDVCTTVFWPMDFLMGEVYARDEIRVPYCKTGKTQKTEDPFTPEVCLR